ncbi:MAG: gamma-glutamyltransferase family protein [Polyangiaceae bacterium]|nr:gamma-glutamyltransferase family protein [Polyangiaceae bacterium]
MTRKLHAAVAPSAELQNVVEEILRKGNAVDAVVAGVFAACAVSPGVLLGPVQILIGGAGAGLCAFDGRVRQPGLGVPRPRGFPLLGQDIPNAARIGVPWLPATLSAALATSGTATLAQVLAPAIALASGTPRAMVLSQIAGRGPRAIEERPISSELFALAGRANGGLLTTRDLASPEPKVIMATRTEIGLSHVFTLPWEHIEGGLPAAPAVDVDIQAVRGLAAVDRHGTFAVAAWNESSFGEIIAELGLRAPLMAEPVRRGIPRERPGEIRPAGAPIALVALAGDAARPHVALAAFGAHDAYDVLQGAVRDLLRSGRIEAQGEARLAAVTRTSC